MTEKLSSAKATQQGACGSAGQTRPHLALLHNVRDGKAKRRQDAREFVDENVAHSQRACDGAGVLPPCAAEDGEDVL